MRTKNPAKSICGTNTAGASSDTVLVRRRRKKKKKKKKEVVGTRAAEMSDKNSLNLRESGGKP
jgi:hypothetical protein